MVEGTTRRRAVSWILARLRLATRLRLLAIFGLTETLSISIPGHTMMFLLQAVLSILLVFLPALCQFSSLVYSNLVFTIAQRFCCRAHIQVRVPLLLLIRCRTALGSMYDLSGMMSLTRLSM